MVDQTDLGRAMTLHDELRSIETAVDFLDREGFGIVGITVGPKNASPRVSVSTDYMEYPPQMVTTIKGLFEQRENAIREELRQIGVTLTDPTAPPPVQPEPQQARRNPRPR